MIAARRGLALRVALAVALACATAGCDRHSEAETSNPTAAETSADNRPGTTVQQFMEQQINPAAEYVFRSVREVADSKGHRLEQPRSEAEWKNVEARLKILRDAPAVLTANNLRVAPPGFKSENPAVESQPAAIQAAIDQDRADFNGRAYRLRFSAEEALLAAEARDAIGMGKMLEGVDRACESCHLRYFYPGDKRAQQAARESYVVN